jgi:hypothetical protein
MRDCSPVKKYAKHLQRSKWGDLPLPSGRLGSLAHCVLTLCCILLCSGSWSLGFHGPGGQLIEMYLLCLVLIQIQRNPSAGLILSYKWIKLKFRDPGHTDVLRVCYRHTHTEIQVYIYRYIYIYTCVTFVDKPDLVPKTFNCWPII